ncbi:hypothetical protein [Jiangella alba]|uniref:hypothetical protein n=1 Tax=Jiangella alba TaxID=561176 RepID=UPI00114D21B1|nr:hypothetical protein [Jiangella alba]
MLHDVETDTTTELPDLFCWTKYGTEAGEDSATILARKEAERLASGGTFLWGIGNAIGPSVEALLAQAPDPQVVFTPMRSRPAARDVAPAQIAVWHRGIALDGEPFELPEHSYVTSRISPTRGHHYALVCRSQEPLSVNVHPSQSFASTHVLNLRSGSKVGASQVTSVVRRTAFAPGLTPSTYTVSFMADLVAPYLVRLTEYSLMDSS